MILQKFQLLFQMKISLTVNFNPLSSKCTHSQRFPFLSLISNSLDSIATQLCTPKRCIQVVHPVFIGSLGFCNEMARSYRLRPEIS